MQLIITSSVLQWTYFEAVNFFAADVLTYGSYCMTLTLLGITALEKYLMLVMYA